MRYQYEASRWRANEQPSRDANEARFQKLPVNAHVFTKNSARVWTVTQSWQRDVFIPQLGRIPADLWSIKYNKRDQTLGFVTLIDGSISSPITNQIYDHYTGMMIPLITHI